MIDNTALAVPVRMLKLCDGFGIALGQFFSPAEFDGLEQTAK